MKPRADIPRAKRAGLDLDLDRICPRGPKALEPDDHYRLKTYGVCAQRQEDLFMIRLRVTGGLLNRDQIETICDAADRYAGGWVHLTTRQNVELHSVRLEDVPGLYRLLEPSGLIGRSACGHTVRNVMSCPEATTSVEEPFDVTGDANRLSRLLLQRSRELNVKLPSRVNIVLGGCSRCQEHALTNDIGLVAQVRDGVAGYQLWVGGSMGTSPRLSFLLRPFITRDLVWPAVWSIISWFCDEGDIDQVAKGRLKFLIEEKGETAFREAFEKRLASEAVRTQPPIEAVEIFSPSDLAASYACTPKTGWRDGITPERLPGYATITVRLPLGDLLTSEFRYIGRLSPSGYLTITPEQNLAIKSVPVERVAEIVEKLAELGLGPDGTRSSIDVTACPGLSFCSLAITHSQEVGLDIERKLRARQDLPTDFHIAVSGCPNSCTKQQAADIGFAGAKMRVNGETRLGYQLFLGADLWCGLVGEPVLKVAEDEAADAAVAAAELWVAYRREGERPADTFRRIGLDVVARGIESRLRRDGEEPRVTAPSERPLARAS